MSLILWAKQKPQHSSRTRVTSCFCYEEFHIRCVLCGVTRHFATPGRTGEACATQWHHRLQEILLHFVYFPVVCKRRQSRLVVLFVLRYHRAAETDGSTTSLHWKDTSPPLFIFNLFSFASEWHRRHCHNIVVSVYYKPANLRICIIPVQLLSSSCYGLLFDCKQPPLFFSNAFEWSRSLRVSERQVTENKPCVFQTCVVVVTGLATTPKFDPLVTRRVAKCRADAS